MERQDVDQRTDLDALGELGRRRKRDRRRTGVSQRRTVMLGHVVAVYSPSVVDLDDLQPILEVSVMETPLSSTCSNTPNFKLASL
jgi:hypothetical protein